MGRCRYTGVLRSQTGVPAHGFRQVVSISRDIRFPLERVSTESRLARSSSTYSSRPCIVTGKRIRERILSPRGRRIYLPLLSRTDATSRPIPLSRCSASTERKESESIRDALSFPPLIGNVCSRSRVLALVFCPCPCPESPFRTPNIEKMMFQLPNGDRSSRGTKLPPHRTGHSSRESAHHRYN